MQITIASNGYQVTVDTLGAELKSFQNPAKKEFIWNSDPKFWMRSSPLLFPTIGNLRDNKTIFDGEEYTLQKHGFCKESEFTVTEKSEDSVTFTLEASAQTLRSYPFVFLLQLTYKLKGSRLFMTYQVSNNDTRDMPYHIGAHPGFMCPFEEGESLADYQLFFEKEENLTADMYDLENLCFSATKKQHFADKSNTLPLTPSMFDNDAVYFPHTNSHKVQLVHKETGKGIEVAYPGFSSVAFWTPIGGNAPFLCIEPWNGAAIYEDEDNVFCHKRDIETLSANCGKTYELEISLLGY